MFIGSVETGDLAQRGGLRPLLTARRNLQTEKKKREKTLYERTGGVHVPSFTLFHEDIPSVIIMMLLSSAC